MEYERLTIPLAQLSLNKENDRHGSLSSEHECIQWMLDNLGSQIRNLAKHIAEYGLSPIDSVLVVPSTDTKGDYVVWEGNRRTVAMKLLDDPNRCQEAKQKTWFINTRSKALADIPDEIECVIAPSLEEAERLIELRHQGPQDGIGTLHWDAQQKSRHLERLGKKGRYSFSQQVIDSYRHKFDAVLLDQIDSKKFYISTLDRLMRNPYVREFLGLTNEDGTARRTLRENETFKGFEKIVQDIAGGLRATDVYDRKDQKAYIDSFPDNCKPDLSKTLKDSVALQPSTSKTIGSSGSRSKPLSHNRPRLIPAGKSYRIIDKRVNSIYHELKKTLKLKDHCNAVSVLFRVFMELSIDFYLDHHKITRHDRELLRKKTGKVIKHMKEQGWLDQAGAKGINKALSSPHSLFSIDTFHSYIHNRKIHPSPQELATAWDNLEPFFDALFNNT